MRRRASRVRRRRRRRRAIRVRQLASRCRRRRHRQRRTRLHPFIYIFQKPPATTTPSHTPPYRAPRRRHYFPAASPFSNLPSARISNSRTHARIKVRRPRLFRSRPLTPWTKSTPAAAAVCAYSGGGGIGRPPHVRVVCGESCPKLRIPRAPPGSLSPGSLFARAHCPAQSIAARGRRGHFGLPPRPRRVSFHRAIFYSSSVLYPHPAVPRPIPDGARFLSRRYIIIYKSSSVRIYV